MEDGTVAKNQELFEPEMISEKRLFLAFLMKGCGVIYGQNRFRSDRVAF